MNISPSPSHISTDDVCRRSVTRDTIRYTKALLVSHSIGLIQVSIKLAMIPISKNYSKERLLETSDKYAYTLCKRSLYYYKKLLNYFIAINLHINKIIIFKSYNNSYII